MGTLRANANLPPRKRAKTQRVFSSANDLPWKPVSRPTEAGIGADDGILELEEVDDVEVLYEETELGRTVKFNVMHATGRTADLEVLDGGEEGNTGESPTRSSPTNSARINFEPTHSQPAFDSETLLESWHPFGLHPQLLYALYKNSFTTPTPIQAQALPLGLAGRDVIGVAETGSGKTLAYGLPILSYVLSQAPLADPSSRRVLRALILVPARELALQVSSHLKGCLAVNDDLPVKADGAATDAFPVSKVNGKHRAKVNLPLKPLQGTPPRVSIGAIVGGMAYQKQRKILDRGVEVLVATPGRLWDLIQEDDTLASQLRSLQFLVLDEADRLIEDGRFEELDNILRLTLRGSSGDQIAPEFDDNRMVDRTVGEGADGGDHMQTFVFSATLSKDLQRSLRKRNGPHYVRKRSALPPSSLDDLLLRLDFRDPEPATIDISPQGGVVSTLQESKIECLSKDKDFYLYYFLLRYPGRSLVFLSSIDGIRRLLPIMELLGLKAFPLHSQLEQRQRLKNLDQFKATDSSVLLATDLASRGLDILSIDHVIHYQIPRSADAYIHRNGRTARALNKGFSMLMCAPEESRLVKSLLSTLHRKESEISEMPIDLDILDKLKTRVQLARKIDSANHKVKKENHDRNWMRKTAEAMEILLDSDFVSDTDGEHNNKPKRRKIDRQAETTLLKAELKSLLKQPLLVRGVSAKYITSGSRPIVDGLVAGDYHDAMLGVKKADAGCDILPAKRKKVEMVNKDAGDQEEEEWFGIGDKEEDEEWFGIGS